MSRIYEALKRAEEQREASGASEKSRPIDSAAGGAVHSGGTGQRSTEILSSLTLGGASPSSQSLRIDDLRRRCKKPGWKLDPNTVVFCDKRSFAHCAEQFRTLRSHLDQVRGVQQVRTLLVTSTLPNEGKTFVALNLAHSIVRQPGRKALLVDTDLRASRLHVPMGAPSAPGLADFLRGEADEFSIIQTDGKSDLFFIPAGKQIANPAELVANGELKNLLDRLAPVFDWIILDAPPILPVADATVLAGMCDGVIFVVRAGSTGFDLAQAACQELRGKNLLGVVLNRAEEIETYGAYSYYGGNGMDKR